MKQGIDYSASAPRYKKIHHREHRAHRVKRQKL